MSDLEINVRLTEEQADYILQYLGTPIVPVTKDLEVKDEIEIQIASAKSKAEYQQENDKKFKETMLIIAKIIIAKHTTGREAFVDQEWKNILTRVVDVNITSDVYQREYFRLIFDNDHVKGYYIVARSYVDSWLVWEQKEVQPLPWLDPDRELFLVLSESGLKLLDRLME